MNVKFLTLLLFAFSAAHPCLAQKPSYKICVPKSTLPACRELMSKQSEVADIECVAGRDRVECLDMVERRTADFMAADPEDLYLAFKKKNEDFTVFADIRTKEEMRAEFRYEAIILIRRNSSINSLGDLRGKKACHTGYGRNVGYKIPLTKLQNAGIFKIDSDVHLTPVEREIKALSEFFSAACLVNFQQLDSKLKTSYSNLCALCEDPAKCDYPDRFSGYDGAIRCLVENGGDVAFTKVIFVRKYFGLPIGHADKSETKAQANPDEFVYLCEDGTRVPVTGPACTWAARPWQAFVGNGDVKQKELGKLQQRLKNFYEDGKTANQDFAKQMLIDQKNVVVEKEELLPGAHLDNAKYREVIERQFIREEDKTTSIGGVVRICVSSVEEMKKCQVLKDVAFSRDVRPVLECVLKDYQLCSAALKDNQADVIVVTPESFGKRDLSGLKAILFEDVSDDVTQVIVADADITAGEMEKATIKYDPNDLRSIDAALRFYSLRKAAASRTCPGNLKNSAEGRLEVMSTKQLNQLELKSNEKVLICKDLSKRPLSDFKLCNFDSTLPTAIYVNENANSKAADVIKNVFLTISSKFGHGRPFEVVFELFGEFEKGQHDVLFDDDAEKFVEKSENIDAVEYKKLRCLP